MSTLEPHETTHESWQQVEEFLSNLHELASAPIESEEFYRKLLAGCVATLDARRRHLAPRGTWKLATR